MTGPSISGLRTVTNGQTTILTMGSFDPAGADLLIVVHGYSTARNDSEFREIKFGTTVLSSITTGWWSDAKVRIHYLYAPGSTAQDIRARLNDEESQSLIAFVVNHCPPSDAFRTPVSTGVTDPVNVPSTEIDLVISGICAEGGPNLAVAAPQVLLAFLDEVGDGSNAHTLILSQQPAAASPATSTVSQHTGEGGDYVHVGVAIAALPAPTVTDVDPATGTIAGGTAIAITGTGFDLGATIDFDGVDATSVVVVSATSITCVSPAGAEGEAVVTVTNPDLQSDTGSYTYTDPGWAFGLFFGWYDVTTGTGTITDEGVTVHSGSHAAKFVADGAGNEAYVVQYLDVPEGDTCKVTAWVKGPYTVAIVDDDGNDYVNGTEANWTQVTVERAMGIGAQYIYIGCFATGTLYVDDVTITTIPRTQMFTGRVSAIRPTAGMFDEPLVEVTAQDWMGYLSTQELGVWPILYTKKFNEAISTVLPGFPLQPEDTNFDTGIEEFAVVFNADSPSSSMAAFFQKMARNELGRIYLNGAGELIVENRYARAIQVTPAFVLDRSMTELDVAWERSAISNIVFARVYPAKVDDAATTLLWSLSGAPKIKHGETLEIRCNYTDPSTGQQISAIDVVNPVVAPYVEFGSRGNFTDNDMIAYLSVVNEVGANAMISRFTNTHPTQDGFLNDWQLHGRGVYIYDGITVETRDQDGIDLGTGEKRMTINLEHITDPNTGKNYAAWIKGSVSRSRVAAARVTFIAATDELEEIALNAEISQRFTLIEDATGVGRDFYIQNLQYTFDEGILVCTILGVPDLSANVFVWDHSRYDNEDEARWAL